MSDEFKPNSMLDPLRDVSRLLLTVPLQPIQGDRFQPTGFPSLGAATYQTREGPKLLVESAQSMANRMETTCWDTATNKPISALSGISHVTVNRKGAFLTDTMLEYRRRGHSERESLEVFYNNPCRFFGQCGKWKLKPLS